jgi:ATP-dependent protease Clp ATPase subunit
MESLMANIMYEIPSRADIDKVIITGATVKGSAPEYVLKRDITEQNPEA